jgi:uncharacterized protein (DUF2147 family)
MNANKKISLIDITGAWKVADSDKSFQIEIPLSPGVNLYQGKLTDYCKQGFDDNDTANHHNSPFTGQDILIIKFNPDKNYGKGSLLDIESGKTYICTLSLVEPDTLLLISI